MLKLIVMGHGRHGKDTVAELLGQWYAMSCVSSSWWAANAVVFPRLQELNGHEGAPVYADVDQCYADRANHRIMWFEMIKEFNSGDGTRLGREIFQEHDVYIGIRNQWEFHALKNTRAFDYALWVDASDRLPPEGALSCTVAPWMADFVINNNGTLDELHANVRNLMTTLMQETK